MFSVFLFFSTMNLLSLICNKNTTTNTTNNNNNNKTMFKINDNDGDVIVCNSFICI